MRILFIVLIVLIGCSLALTLTANSASNGPTSTPTHTPLTTTPTNTAVASVALDLLGRINLVRLAAELPPYHLNDALMKAAQDQAEWMVRTGSVLHIRPDGSTPGERARNAGYLNPASCSENIYMGQIANEDYAWDFWTHSKIHYAGLVSQWHDEIGIATAHNDIQGQAFVLVFGASGVPWPTRPPVTVTLAGPTQTPGPTLTATATIDATYTSYVVQPGDTLFQIATQFGTSVDKLVEANGITNPDRIEIGQVVIIP
jgi:uncharacterized protein YkwD